MEFGPRLVKAAYCRPNGAGFSASSESRTRPRRFAPPRYARGLSAPPTILKRKQSTNFELADPTLEVSTFGQEKQPPQMLKSGPVQTLSVIWA